MTKHCLVILLLIVLSAESHAQDLVNGDIHNSGNLSFSELHGIARGIDDIQDQKSNDFTLFTRKDKERANFKSKDISDFVILQIEEKSLSGLKKNYKTTSQVKLSIPTKNKTNIDLLLQPVSIFADDIQFVTAQGDEILIDQSNYAFYNGIVEGDKTSFVSLSITPSGAKLVMSDRNGNYNITRLKGSDSEYVFYNDYRLNQVNSFSCGNELSERLSKPLISPEEYDEDGNLKSRILKTSRDRVEVEIEMDYDIYLDHGSNVINSFDWGIELMTAAINWYQTQYISLALSKITVWTHNNDPFNNIGADSDKLDDQLYAWSTHRNPHGDLVHYLGREKGIDGSKIGKANGIGGICDPLGGFFDYTTAHCVSLGMSSEFSATDSTSSDNYGFDVPSWELEVFCHEMGHVFGSPHTHHCGWGATGFEALDNCAPTEEGCDPGPAPVLGGTMMSYCDPINLSKGFHDEPAHLIRETIRTSDCFSHYEELCPELNTIVNQIDNNAIHLANRTIFIYDGSVATGFSPTMSSGEKLIIYGDFSVPLGAGIKTDNTGCN